MRSQIASQREGEAQGHGEWREGERGGGFQKSAQEGTGTSLQLLLFSQLNSAEIGMTGGGHRAKSEV